MLETELIAMKLCKLKMEADKTEAELQVKQMEKTLHALQNGHSSQVRVRPPSCTPNQTKCKKELNIQNLCLIELLQQTLLRCACSEV
jgi:hypothetical protein